MWYLVRAVEDNYQKRAYANLICMINVSLKSETTVGKILYVYAAFHTILRENRELKMVNAKNRMKTIPVSFSSRDPNLETIFYFWAKRGNCKLHKKIISL